MSWGAGDHRPLASTTPSGLPARGPRSAPGALPSSADRNNHWPRIAFRLLAAEYLLSSGDPDVVLCERSIKTFETATRNTLDLAAVALAKELSHLPVIADPSHGTGIRSLVPAASRAAVAIDADGLMIEVHPCPERALSDGPQSLDLPGFAALMESLAALKPVAEVA